MTFIDPDRRKRSNRAVLAAVIAFFITGIITILTMDNTPLQVLISMAVGLLAGVVVARSGLRKG